MEGSSIVVGLPTQQLWERAEAGKCFDSPRPVCSDPTRWLGATARQRYLPPGARSQGLGLIFWLKEQPKWKKTCCLLCSFLGEKRGRGDGWVDCGGGGAGARGRAGWLAIGLTGGGAVRCGARMHAREGG